MLGSDDLGVTVPIEIPDGNRSRRHRGVGGVVERPLLRAIVAAHDAQCAGLLVSACGWKRREHNGRRERLRVPVEIEVDDDRRGHHLDVVRMRIAHRRPGPSALFRRNDSIDFHIGNAGRIVVVILGQTIGNARAVIAITIEEAVVVRRARRLRVGAGLTESAALALIAAGIRADLGRGTATIGEDRSACVVATRPASAAAPRPTRNAHARKAFQPVAAGGRTGRRRFGARSTSGGDED